MLSGRLLEISSFPSMDEAVGLKMYGEEGTFYYTFKHLGASSQRCCSLGDASSLGS